MKKIFTTLLVLIIILLGFLFYNYYKLSPAKSNEASTTSTDISSIQGADERFSKAITFQTVSFEDTSKIDYSQFLGFQDFLKTSFPEVFKNLELVTIHQYTLLLKWKGKDSTLLPGILMAHQDVVPVSDDTKDLWTFSPFEGLIEDGYLTGRGTVDDKNNLMSQLEAVEFLLKNNFQPKRDLYFVFGHDEEIGGENGAQQVAKLLQSQNIHAEFVLDEGGFVTRDKVPGLPKPVALIGTSEKGYLNLELSVNINGGHSSMPDKENAIAVMSQAISDLNKNPFPASITPSVKDFLYSIAPYSPFMNRLAISNMWLFEPMVIKEYSKLKTGNAMVRTTMVPTIIQGGVKDNVIPNIVTTNINYRLLTGTTIQDAVQYTEKVINQPKIKVKVKGVANESSEVSPIDNETFQSLSPLIKATFGDIIVSPFLMIAATDSRHFSNVSKNIYKFSPAIDPEGFHGVNERIKVEDYYKSIQFYVDFIKNN